MKVTFVSLLALASSFTTVISTPLAEPATLAKRVDPESLVTSLFATVQSHTKIINSTTDTLSPSSSAEEKAAAGEIFTAQLAAINAAVVDATNSLSKRSFDLEERQLPNPAALAGLVVNLLLDISGALNNIIADLGLTATLSFLGPLVGSLSALLLALDGVVDQLLALVKQLLDGLLIGLSLALAGLVL